MRAYTPALYNIIRSKLDVITITFALKLLFLESSLHVYNYIKHTCIMELQCLINVTELFSSY